MLSLACSLFDKVLTWFFLTFRRSATFSLFYFVVYFSSVPNETVNLKAFVSRMHNLNFYLHFYYPAVGDALFCVALMYFFIKYNLHSGNHRLRRQILQENVFALPISLFSRLCFSFRELPFMSLPQLKLKLSF